MFDVGGQGLAVYDSSDKFYNNVACNASLEVDPSISGHNDASNKNLRGTCGGSFVAYQALSSNPFVYDFHLASGDTTLKDAGTPMASYFTTDKDGVTRPQGSAWDIGGYEYVGGGDTTPPAAPTGLAVN
jgi:hypothetical protein